MPKAKTYEEMDKRKDKPKRGMIGPGPGIERYHLEKANIPQYVSDMSPREKMHYQAQREMSRDKSRAEDKEPGGRVYKAKERMKKYSAEDKAFQEGFKGRK